MSKYKLNNTNDKEQLKAIKEGFYEIIPKDINETFDEFELKVKKKYNLFIINILKKKN